MVQKEISNSFRHSWSPEDRNEFGGFSTDIKVPLRINCNNFGEDSFSSSKHIIKIQNLSNYLSAVSSTVALISNN